MDEESKPLSVLVAFLIDLFATFLCQASYLFMKFAHLKAEATKKSAVCSCKYMAGLLSLVVGSLIHIAVLPFCPLVLIAMNSATAIIISALLAIAFLDEKLVWHQDSVAFILIVGGCTGIILLSKSQVTVLTSSDVADQLT